MTSFSCDTFKIMKNCLNQLFWFTDAKKLDVQNDKHLIIHHVLSYGSLEDIRYLFMLYPKSVIKKTFVKPKKGIYDPRALAFVKALLNIRTLDFSKYIKNVSKALP